MLACNWNGIFEVNSSNFKQFKVQDIQDIFFRMCLHVIETVYLNWKNVQTSINSKYKHISIDNYMTPYDFDAFEKWVYI